MEKSSLPIASAASNDEAPGLPEGLIVGKDSHENRVRLRRGLQALFLFLSCLVVAHIGFATIRDHFAPGRGHHHSPTHPWFPGQSHKGPHGPHGPPEPLACYPLPPGDSVNVTLHLKPGAGPPPPPPPPPSPWAASLSRFLGKKAPPPPRPHGPPHIYLHPSLFSSDVALLRDGKADKDHLGHSPGGPEGITVYAIFSRNKINATLTSDEKLTAKRVDICTHRAPDGAMVGAFLPPPWKNLTDTSIFPSPPLPHHRKGGGDKKKHRPFPPHPKDQFPDISAEIHLPAGLGIHLDSLPPPPPHHKKHRKDHKEGDR